jgi:acetyl-CoA decarbonylase/synthase complex subunit gamma
MGLSGIEIFKMLPKTNCGECKFPTCLAFAMQLAAGKVEIDQCPYVSEDIKAKLSEASAPPIRGVMIGDLKIGEETVLFRHEKRFVNPPGFAVMIKDTMGEDEVEERVNALERMGFERVGLMLRPEIACLKNETNDKVAFERLVNMVKEKGEFGMILMGENLDAIRRATTLLKDRKPLLCAATKENLDEMVDIAKESGSPVVASADGLDELSRLTERLTKAGIKEIVLHSRPKNLREAFTHQVYIRRAALKGFRPLGFPTIVFPCELVDDPMKEALYAAVFVSKYGGIIVLGDLDPAKLFPLLVLRMNIYTDPQRPMTIQQGIYEINGPGERSPVIVTTNFSLTYFIVSGEVEGSKVPTWLCIMDTEGLSTMTAWAAGKFVPDLIARFIKKIEIKNRIAHSKLIIPGYVAQISGELEEELGEGWKVVVGPREAAELPVFLQNFDVN